MRKDIGSIYDVSINELSKDFESSFLIEKHFLFSLCREALFVIASSKDCNKKVLLPAYTCDTVIAPFRQLGWECHYYAINKELRIDTESFIASFDNVLPSIVVAHPYYGMSFLQEEISTLKYANENGAEIVVDLTQSIFSEQKIDFVDYYVGSYRKWFPIPDGGFLCNNSDNKLEDNILPKEENTVFVSTQFSAMILRNMYFNTDNEQVKAVSRNLTKAADIYSEEKITPHLMSNVSKNIMQNEDVELDKKQRLINYKYLFENIKQTNNLSFVNKDLDSLQSAPLYFPIYVKNRNKLQKRLIDEHIYAPVLWPIEDNNVLINKDIEEIYNTILVIPIDQRYGIKDMERIVNVINN